LKTEYGLKNFGICFKRSMKVLNFQYFTMWTVSAHLSNPLHLRVEMWTASAQLSNPLHLRVEMWTASAQVSNRLHLRVEMRMASAHLSNPLHLRVGDAFCLLIDGLLLLIYFYLLMLFI